MHIGLYVGIFVGVFFEGEAVLLSAIIAAQHEHIPLIPVVIIAYVAAVLADTFFFFIGKSKGAKWLSSKKAFQKHTGKARKFLRKNQTTVLLTYRFMYGLRSILPMMVAIDGVPFRRFILFSIGGSAVWAIAISLLGVLVGEMVIEFLDHIHQVEFYLIGALLIFAVIAGAKRYINHFSDVTATSWEELTSSD